MNCNMLLIFASIFIFMVSGTSSAKDLKPVDNSTIIDSGSVPGYPRFRAGADRSTERVTIDPCQSYRWASRPYLGSRSVQGPRGRFSAGSRSRLPADIPSTYSRGPENLAAEIVIGQKSIAGRDVEISKYFDVGNVYDYDSCQDLPGFFDSLK